MPSDPELPTVFTRRIALDAGLTRNQIESRAGRAVWLRLRRGVFCRRETYASCPPDQRHLLHAAAARLANPSAQLVESHLTAAARFGLPMPLGESPRAMLTDGSLRHSTRIDQDSVIEVATLCPGDVRTLAGVPLTSPARTVADCLRHYAAVVSVPIADAAIQARLTSLAEARDVLSRQSSWPYAGRARSSLPLVDGRRESWLESVSAVNLWQQGIPLAEPQVEIFDREESFIARVDGMWRESATVGEADGRQKYSLADWPDLAAVAPSELAEAHREAAARVVRREKQREDELRDAGLEVVRWSTAQILGSASRVAARVRQAQSRGQLSRFTGSFRSQRAA